MALVKCHECGEQVSSTAAACPKCGAPVKIAGAVSSWATIKWSLISLAALFVLVRCAALMNPTQTLSSKPTAAAHIAAPPPPPAPAAAVTDPRPPAPTLPPAPPPTAAEIAKDKALEEKLRVGQRMAFASETEETFLKHGQSVTVTAQGKNADTMRFRYALVSKAFAYQVQHQDTFMQRVRSLGFKKLILDDGFETTYTFDLSK